MLHTDVLAVAAQVNQTIALCGLSGIGKTAISRALATEIQEKVYGGKPYPLVLTNAAQAQPEDIGGGQVPNHETKTMDSYAMGAIKTFIKHGRGLHLVDEYGSCNDAMAAAMLSVEEGRQYGDFHLPDVSLILCMNPVEHATNARALTAAETNRILMLDWKLDNAAFLDYLRGGKGALSNFPILPKDWKDFVPAANNLVAAFLERQSSLIHIQPEPEKANRPWPSPRSWERAATMIGAFRSLGGVYASYAGDHIHTAVNGLVGSDTGDQFFNWIKDLDLPDPEEILSTHTDNSGQFKWHGKLPTRQDRLIVALETLAAAACQKSRPDHKERWERAWAVLDPVAQMKQDAAYPAVKILGAKDNVPAGATIPGTFMVMFEFLQKIGVTKQGVNV